MALHTTNEEIWKWHLILTRQHEEGITKAEFCRNNDLDYKTFCNKLFRMVYKKYTNPVLYNKLLPITRDYINSNLPPSRFMKLLDESKRQDITQALLTEMATHLKYVDAIEEIRAQKEGKPMNFIQVPMIKTQEQKIREIIEPEPEQEVLKKQNDIELLILNGVKVVVAPNISADKLLRIIELLKDL